MNITIAKVFHIICGVALVLFSGLLPAKAQSPTPTPPGNEGNWSWAAKTDAIHPSGGVYGANRRVEIQGYGSVKGTFADPTFDVKPTLGKPGTRWEGKRINKPTFYLGAKTSGIQTDGGLQWEPNPLPIPGGQIVIPPGWTMFHAVTISVATGQWKLWKETSKVRAPYQGLGQTVLRYEVQPDGRVMLYMNSATWGYDTLGPYTTLWPKNSSGNVDVAGAYVRRVVALTQADTATSRVAGEAGHKSTITFDGSIIHNLYFSQGRVANKVGINLPETDFRDWLATGSTNNLLPNTRISSSSPWPIDFELPSTPRLKDAAGTYSTGYSTEKVVIDLRSSRISRGKQAEPSSR